MHCSVYKKVTAPGISEAKVVAIVTSVLRRERAGGALVSVHLIGDTRMKRLNSLYRGKHTTTDVLSFAAQEGEGLQNENDLGDIFISVPQIRRQAKQWDVGFSEEFTRMLVHGILHLLGYDHADEHNAKIMFAKQERYVNVLQP